MKAYGADRILKHVTNQPATVLSLLNDVHNFSSGYPESDDVTVVMIAVRVAVPMNNSDCQSFNYQEPTNRVAADVLGR